jgi:hypothetical protein
LIPTTEKKNTFWDTLLFPDELNKLGVPQLNKQKRRFFRRLGSERAVV